MSNVNPGDIAKVVGSPTINNGKQCYVLEYCTCGNWTVQLLQPAINGATGAPLQAGELVCAEDFYLRRVDPPGDDIEVLDTRELEAV